MTENKRFKIKKLEYEVYFIDSQQEYVDEDEPNFKIDGEKTLSDSQILDLLNENEGLKQSYKEFEDECQSTFDAMSRKQNDLYRKNFKLKEENEQLKAHYNSLSHNNGLLHDECTNKIDALKKEKEKIKQQRDFYYARLQKIIKVANGDWE